MQTFEHDAAVVEVGAGFRGEDWGDYSDLVHCVQNWGGFGVNLVAGEQDRYGDLGVRLVFAVVRSIRSGQVRLGTFGVGEELEYLRSTTMTGGSIRRARS